MAKTNFSIGSDPVVDFSCEGWPSDKRAALSNEIAGISGVSNVVGAGISTVRAYYNSKVVERDQLIAAVGQLADNVLPGYNFSE